MTGCSRDREAPPACAVEISLPPFAPIAAQPSPPAPAPPAQRASEPTAATETIGLTQPALAAVPGARELTLPDAHPGTRGPGSNAEGPVWPGGSPWSPDRRPCACSSHRRSPALPGRRRLIDSRAGGPMQSEWDLTDPTLGPPAAISAPARTFAPIPWLARLGTQHQLGPQHPGQAHMPASSYTASAGSASLAAASGTTAASPPTRRCRRSISHERHTPTPTTHLRPTSTTPQAGWVQSATNRKD